MQNIKCKLLNLNMFQFNIISCSMYAICNVEYLVPFDTTFNFVSHMLFHLLTHHSLYICSSCSYNFMYIFIV